MAKLPVSEETTLKKSEVTSRETTVLVTTTTLAPTTTAKPTAPTTPEPSPSPTPEPTPTPTPKPSPTPTPEPTPTPTPTPEPTPTPTPTPEPTTTEAPTEAIVALAELSPAEAPRDFVLNKNTKKFHEVDCGSAAQIKEKNRLDVFDTWDNVISMGYVPCKNCH